MIDSEWIQDPDRLLTVFGAFLFAVSVLYFGRETILDLSPYAKSFLLLAASGIFLAGSKYTEDNGFRLAGYLFSTVSYLTFLIYYTFRMSPSSEVIFLMLAFSGILFIAIGKKLDSYKMEKQFLKKAAVAVSLVAFAVIAVDTVAPEPQYELNFKQDVSIGEEPVDLGTVEIRNSYLLPQIYDVGNLRVCGSEREFRVFPDDHKEDSGVVKGMSSKSVKYKLSRHPTSHNISAETFLVETVDSCPEQVQEDRLQIVREERKLD